MSGEPSLTGSYGGTEYYCHFGGILGHKSVHVSKKMLTFSSRLARVSANVSIVLLPVEQK